MGEINDNDAYEEELLDYEEEDEKAPDSASIKAADSAKKGYVGVHSSGFRDFLLKPELLRSIVDSGFEHPSEVTVIRVLMHSPKSKANVDTIIERCVGAGHLRDDILHYSKEPAEYLLSDLPSSYGEGATSSSMGYDSINNKIIFELEGAH
ncbi:hypothetical protein ERO13_D10G172275v2 [Gossypium hirsutum]|uniref:ATP-dependent RNA helicase uap56 n=3 Tax=Gossypium TaxID=3633 RepID=A0ABM3ATW0_GOSHI|nr:ATP-dependent RNA helicase uap56 [Gossypium hirsutum]XP_040958293.1 ATP-dependent RNA helicase uap56 [Gossypium hirsutum]KAG4126694.1 hypothetical protein ERO13_D10G172275v2 [Gossypium hirsutum]